MSRENVEIVRQATEAYSRGELEEAFGFMATDVEWDMSNVPVPDPEVYRGRDQLESFEQTWNDSWESVQIEPLEYIEHGDQVISVLRQFGRGKLSGVEVEQTFAQLWTLRDGKVVRVAIHADVEEAREAANAGEPAET